MIEDERPRPLYKRMSDDKDVHNLVVPMSIELSYVTSAKIADMPALEKLIDHAFQDLEARFEKAGFKLYVRSGLVKAITQADLLTILPRKMHMAQTLSSGVLNQICDTPHVSAKNLTTNEDAVTCKRCLKLIEHGS